MWTRAANRIRCYRQMAVAVVELVMALGKFVLNPNVSVVLLARFSSSRMYKITQN